MKNRSTRGEPGEYEALLIKDDRFDRVFRMALFIIPIGMSLFYRVGPVYVWATGLVLLRAGYDAVDGLRMRRLGYWARGTAILGGLWWWLGFTALFGCLWAVQSHYQLWFTQDRLCVRTC